MDASGSFIVDVFAALAGLPGQPLPVALVTVGLGGFCTTFSPSSVRTLNLARDGRVGGNLLASVALCLLAAWAGFGLGAPVSGA